MKRFMELIEEINELTLKIEQEYPELYQYLGEIPITIPNRNHPNVDDKDLTDYLDSLNQMLMYYLESNKKVVKN